MLTREDLQAISLLVKNEVEPINTRLDGMDNRLDKMENRLDKMESRLDKMENRLDTMEKNLVEINERLDTIEENGEITRDVTNKIGEWVDFYFHDDKPYPLDEEEMEKYKARLKFAE